MLMVLLLLIDTKLGISVILFILNFILSKYL